MDQISSWLSGCSQHVVLNGQASDPVPVLSSVPQGSVLRQILFLIFINDLPDKIKSSVGLFVDDCVLCRNINSLQDCLILQEDLDSLGLWEAEWQMKFNVAKCHYESDPALLTQTNQSWLHSASANFGKHSAPKISWYNNHREHGLGSTYL